MSDLSVKNAAVLREFYLSPSIRKRGGRTVRRCDLIVFDLDPADSFMVLFENKLFGKATTSQLAEYRDTCNEKYERAKTIEFVYLTLLGEPPDSTSDSAADRATREWIQMSWLEDISAALNEAVQSTNRPPHDAVASFQRLLAWLKRLADPQRLPEGQRRLLRQSILTAAVDCLLEELQRLRKPETGEWSRNITNDTRAVIYHPARRSAKLNVALTTNLSVMIQGTSRKGAEFEKIIVPFGTLPDQVFNSIDLSARDIYYEYFDNAARYLAGHRRTKVRSDTKLKNLPLFKFLSQHPSALKVALLPRRTADSAAAIQGNSEDVCTQPALAEQAVVQRDSPDEVEQVHDDEPTQ